jgi:hypothetical protein
MSDTDELRFDVFISQQDGHITRLFSNVSLTTAEIMSGMGRDEFDTAIMHHGWSGTSPAWTSFRPVVIVPHGELLKLDQFAYLIEQV